MWQVLFKAESWITAQCVSTQACWITTTFNVTLSTTEEFWNFEIFEILFLKNTPKYQDIYGHKFNHTLLLKNNVWYVFLHTVIIITMFFKGLNMIKSLFFSTFK